MAEPARHARTLRLGTRGSQLARWQAEWVAGELRRLGHTVELVEIATHGDVDRTRPIEELGTRGVFTKAIQQALLENTVDLAVHSLKDLPTEPVPGLVLAAVPMREKPTDALIEARGARSEEQEEGGDGHSALAGLRIGARVGTGSLRRQSQLRFARPDLVLEEVRGNVETRIRKLDQGQFDAIVLAEAGLKRLGLAGRVTQLIPLDVMLPAVGQGALGIECRAEDEATRTALAPLDDADTHCAVLAERALLHHLRGGCMAPVGAMAVAASSQVHLRAVVLNASGTKRIEAKDSADVKEAEALGRRVADALLAQGAADLISESRGG